MPDCRVMVVDDDQDTCDAIVELLRVEGYEAAGATDGHEALRLLERGAFRPDVFVLDLYMPTMNGEELRKKLQARPEWAQIPVVLCSGTTAVGSEGAFDVLQKPMDVEALLGVIRRGCAARPPPRKQTA